MPFQLILAKHPTTVPLLGRSTPSPVNSENQVGTALAAPFCACGWTDPRGLSRLRRVIAFLILSTLVFCVSPSLAKKKTVTSKTVSGQVLDPKDNGLDGATIALKDLQTGKTIEVFTEDGGHYQFTDLRFDHDYELQAKYKGAKSETRQVSSFDTRARVVINFTFPPPSS